MVYPINESLERLMDSFIDPETGELLEWWRDPESDMLYQVSDELIESEIRKLQLDFDEKIVELRNLYINQTAEAEALKAEKMKLEKRQKQASNAADRTKRFLAYLLKGEKYQNGTCKISYRRSEEVAIGEGFVQWADMHFPSLLKYQEPKPDKTEIKKAIKAGFEVDFARLENKNNIQIS